MRIGIDGRYQGQPLTGVPRYIDQLCQQLDTLLPHAQFFLYAASADGIRLPSQRWTLRVEPNRRLATLKPNLWWKFFAHRLIREDRIDVLWAAAGFLPRRIRGVPYVLTVYDLTFRLFPETMPPFNLWAHRLFFGRDLRNADRVMAISEGTSRRLMDFYGRGADIIVRPDADERFQPQTAERQDEVRRHYALEQPFLMAVSTLEPRKNLPALIEAFLKLRRRGELVGHELVLIGKKGWRDTALAESIAADEGRAIRSLGFVPDADLPALYSACDLFCMPSLYEGFGIPVLEARRCGAVVLTTDLPELREAGDLLCHYVSPDAESIADGIALSVNGKDRHRDGLHQAQSTSWADEARKVAALLTKK